MKKTFLLLMALLLSSNFYAQTVYETIKSERLKDTRRIKIQLPRNYELNKEKRYPVILVFDGDYLFEPVAGNVDYFSYWEEIPEAIVIGVIQKNTREDDCFFNDLTFLPEKKGASFFEFIGYELLPKIDEDYRTASFRVAVGHNQTANFANYFLMKENPLFRGYLNICPEFALKTPERVLEKMNAINSKLWYYVATGANDVKKIREEALAFDTMVKALENENIKYRFDDFDNATHYTVAANAIPRALVDIFSIYPPISKKEYKEVISTLGEEENAYDYLVNKYKTIAELFFLDKTIRINDFLAVSTALEKKQDWENLEKLGNLAVKEHPTLMLGHYYLGTAYEQLGEPKKAMNSFENGFLLEDVSFLTKDMLLQKVEQIKEDFGY